MITFEIKAISTDSELAPNNKQKVWVAVFIDDLMDDHMEYQKADWTMGEIADNFLNCTRQNMKMRIGTIFTASSLLLTTTMT